MPSKYLLATLRQMNRGFEQAPFGSFLAYRFQYRAPDRTLKAEDVDAAHRKVFEALTSKVGVKFR